MANFNEAVNIEIKDNCLLAYMPNGDVIPMCTKISISTDYSSGKVYSIATIELIVNVKQID